MLFGPWFVKEDASLSDIVSAFFRHFRFPKDAKVLADVPGPGSYDHVTSLGNQRNSKKRSSSTPKFGTATRAQVNKVYLGPGITVGAPKAETNPGFTYATGGNEVIVSYWIS